MEYFYLKPKVSRNPSFIGLECLHHKMSAGAEQVGQNIVNAIGKNTDAETLVKDLKNVSATFRSRVKEA